MSAGSVDVRPFEPDDADGVARLAITVQWPSVSDPDVVRRVCDAPGSTAFVAVVQPEDEHDAPLVVGWAQALGDGVLQSHLSFLAVHPDHRRRGIARLLVVAVFQSTGTLRMDLVTTPGVEGFYEGFAHRTMAGYRLYPGRDPG